MSADIIKKLKNLKGALPSAEWKKSNREFLMSEIKNIVPVAGETWASELSRIVFPWRVLKLAARPALALISVIALVLGSGLSVSASDRALPGDALYGLKIATENVQMALTFNKKEAAKMHVELAGKRVNEVRKIKENSDSPQNKIQKINVAIDKFKEEISTVQNNLETMKNESSPAAMVEMAKIVDSKATEYRDDLAETTSEMPAGGEAAEKINQGVDMTETTSDQALAVIVENHVQGEVVQPEEDVLKRVEQKFETTEARVTEVEGQVNGLTLPVDPAATFVAQQTAGQAKEVLAEAREALDQKDLGIALGKVMESKELAKQAEQIATGASAAAAVAAVPVETPCVECNTNSELTNIPADATNTNTNINTNTNTSTVKPYVAPVKVVPPPEPVIDESTLKVGIDLRQEPIVK